MIDLNFPVSLFRTYIDPSPIKNIPLLSFFTITSESLQKKVSEIRELKSIEIQTGISQKKKIKSIKAKLPCITPSGCFSFRNKDSQISHSGFICIDIDDIKAEDISDIKNRVSELPYAAITGISVSGTGVFMIAEMQFPERHEDHFEFLKRDIKDKLGLDIDKSCRDTTRLRGYTWDEDLIVNENAEKVSGLWSVEREATRPRPNTSALGANRFFRLLDIISNTGVDITSVREDWIKIGTGIASEFGESGYSYFETISANYPEFSVQECQKEWKSCLKGGNSQKASINSVFYIAKKYGVVLN